MREMQDMRIKAFMDFKVDVDTDGYPEAGHSVAIKDDAFDAFMAKVQG